MVVQSLNGYILGENTFVCVREIKRERDEKEDEKFIINHDERRKTKCQKIDT